MPKMTILTSSMPPLLALMMKTNSMTSPQEWMKPMVMAAKDFVMEDVKDKADDDTSSSNDNC